MTTVTIKERVTGFIKKFGAELALEFYHDDLAVTVKELFKDTSPELLAELIHSSEELRDTDQFVIAASEYRGILEGYSIGDLAKVMFELLSEVRPDLGRVMGIIGESAAVWFTMNVQALRDKIVNPERYEEEVDKTLMLRVTCETCEKSFRIYKEDAEFLKMCPFCGFTDSALEQPPDDGTPELAEEEE